uniref:Ubiquitin-activating enzyme E1 C-terminal domain-containing protein n=1 Tax=Meloidogyne incognita TaxID=6306 RepID=A0A914ME96_MELIC
MLPPPPPPNADFDIYGNLTLSQFFDEIKKFTESQVQIVCSGNLQIYSYFANPPGDVLNMQIPEAIQHYRALDAIAVVERTQRNLERGMKPAARKEPMQAAGEGYYFNVYCSNGTMYNVLVKFLNLIKSQIILSK